MARRHPDENVAGRSEVRSYSFATASFTQCELPPGDRPTAERAAVDDPFRALRFSNEAAVGACVAGRALVGVDVERFVRDTGFL